MLGIIFLHGLISNHLNIIVILPSGVIMYIEEWYSNNGVCVNIFMKFICVETLLPLSLRFFSSSGVVASRTKTIFNFNFPGIFPLRRIHRLAESVIRRFPKTIAITHNVDGGVKKKTVYFKILHIYKSSPRKNRV